MTIFILNFILLSEPAGEASFIFRTGLVAAMKFCLQAADYAQETTRQTLIEWHKSPQYKAFTRFELAYDNPRPPLHVRVALYGCEFGDHMLRHIGSLLASAAISYRNYGSASPLTVWPARFLLTARGLFTPEEVLNVSFTPTWATNLWSFMWY